MATRWLSLSTKRVRKTPGNSKPNCSWQYLTVLYSVKRYGIEQQKIINRQTQKQSQRYKEEETTKNAGGAYRPTDEDDTKIFSKVAKRRQRQHAMHIGIHSFIHSFICFRQQGPSTKPTQRNRQTETDIT